MFWGFCEALDLYNEYQSTFKVTNGDSETKEELNILLYGSGDPRFILKTLAKSYKHGVKINFFVIEGCLEIIARNILLLSIALEPPTEFSLKGKTQTFMDLYGNSLLRPISHSYMCSKAKHFLNVITDLDYAKEKIPILNFDQLKYRERDALENIFNFWLERKGNIFNIAKYWENRNRELLKTRYDNRNGVFDWDLQMRLKDYGAEQICSQEYKHWRDVGVAFVFPEYEQAMPNKTLAADLCRNGTTYRHRGYVGDITVGPFTTFGLKCDDANLLRSEHGANFFRASDITERNLFEIMFEIQERRSYESCRGDLHQFGTTVLDMGTAMPPVTPECNESDLRKYEEPTIKIDNLTVTFLPLDDTMAVQKRENFKAFFDVVFVARNYFSFLKEDFGNIFKEKCLVMFETRQYSTLRKEEIADDLKRIKEYAKVLNLSAVTNYAINKTLSMVKYRNCKSN